MNTKKRIMKTKFVKIAVSCLFIASLFIITSKETFAQQDNSSLDQQENQFVSQHQAMSIQNNQFEAQYHQKEAQNKQHADQHKNIEAQKIAFITQQLKLTPDEAKVFWPVYNEYDAKRHELRKSFRESGGFQKADIDKLTESEANQILDNQIIEAQKFLDLRKEYHAKFKSVLPSVKVLKLYDAERDFQKVLMDKIKEHKQTNTSTEKEKEKK
jgi:hypothetical protein